MQKSDGHNQNYKQISVLEVIHIIIKQTKYLKLTVSIRYSWKILTDK